MFDALGWHMAERIAQKPLLAGDVIDIAFTVEGLSLGGSDPVTSDPLPHYASALEKQLGLKLEPVKGLLAVIVIDSVEHPTEN